MYDIKVTDNGTCGIELLNASWKDVESYLLCLFNTLNDCNCLSISHSMKYSRGKWKITKTEDNLLALSDGKDKTYKITAHE